MEYLMNRKGLRAGQAGGRRRILATGVGGRWAGSCVFKILLLSRYAYIKVCLFYATSHNWNSCVPIPIS